MSYDTIAAISTAVSNAGIGIVRISGEESFPIIDKIFQSKNREKRLSQAKTQTVHYGFIVDNDEVVDEVLVMVMRGPGSYTAEDTVEINCHGGIYITRKVLELVLKNGARTAEPGEFTKRAFLNGRIDLSQAEAVTDIIQAQNEYALKSSVRQLRGNLKDVITELRSDILYQIAFIESALDDPEHSDLSGYPERLKKQTKDWLEKLNVLQASYDNGRKIKEGLRTVILGKPNAGKSSLLNVLLGEERAIVTDVAGTTRDTLEEYIQLDGLTLHIVDTAGIRLTEDVVEKIGIEKAKESAKDADLIIYVMDASTEMDKNDEEVMKLFADKKVIVLLNKTDLKEVVTTDAVREKVGYPVISVSAKERKGIDKLEQQIREMFFAGDLQFNDQIYLTNARHKESIEDGIESLKKVLFSIEQDMPEDFYTIDLTDAYESLGSIIGEALGEDLVNEIFSKFCMGK